jgi:hypothetical protein
MDADPSCGDPESVEGRAETWFLFESQIAFFFLCSQAGIDATETGGLVGAIRYGPGERKIKETFQTAPTSKPANTRLLHHCAWLRLQRGVGGSLFASVMRDFPRDCTETRIWSHTP